MVLVEWRDSFRTGIAAVDHEHERLIGLINEAGAALAGTAGRADVEACLGEIYARIAAHFALEEAVMRERGYDEYGDHKADHERLLDEIREIMEGARDAPRERLACELGERLKSWFVVHFKTKDPRLHKMLGML